MTYPFLRENAQHIDSARARIVLGLGFLLAAAIVGGCSQVTFAYQNAGFLAKRYANDYLHLTEPQIDRWEPQLKAGLRRHRGEELPHLAAFFDAALKASRAGFDEENLACLTRAFRALYQRHATLAAGLAAPLLVQLSPDQLGELDRKFRLEAEDDLAGLAKRNLDWEHRKRARRYVEGVENWTGPLKANQKALVTEITDRLPDTEPSLVRYRNQKRMQLIARLRSGASEAETAAFLTSWLADFSDLPPDLQDGGKLIEKRISELLIRLGATLDEHQRSRLEQRLVSMRADFLRLQTHPRLAPVSCTAPAFRTGRP